MVDGLQQVVLLHPERAVPVYHVVRSVRGVTSSYGWPLRTLCGADAGYLFRPRGVRLQQRHAAKFARPCSRCLPS